MLLLYIIRILLFFFFTILLNFPTLRLLEKGPYSCNVKTVFWTRLLKQKCIVFIARLLPKTSTTFCFYTNKTKAFSSLLAK